MTLTKTRLVKYGIFGTVGLVLLLGIWALFKKRTPLTPAERLAVSSRQAVVWHPASPRLLKRFYPQALQAPWSRLLHQGAPVLAMLKKELNSLDRNREVKLHSYQYIFKGKTTYKGAPCGKASVLVRMETPHGASTQGAITDDDGSFQVVMRFDAAEYDPIDYTMNAYTAEFKKVEIVGRRILMSDEETVTIESSLALLPSDPNPSGVIP